MQEATHSLRLFLLLFKCHSFIFLLEVSAKDIHLGDTNRSMLYHPCTWHQIPWSYHETKKKTKRKMLSRFLITFSASASAVRWHLHPAHRRALKYRQIWVAMLLLCVVAPTSNQNKTKKHMTGKLPIQWKGILLSWQKMKIIQAISQKKG